MTTEHDPPGGFSPGPVLVGVDGGWRSAATVRLAAEEAAARGVPLAVVAVVAGGGDPVTSLTGMLADEAAARSEAERYLVQAVSVAREVGVEARSRRLTRETLDRGGAGAGQVAEAGLLVVGDHGPAGQRALSLGSVSRSLLGATRCPVMVVPGDSRPARGAREPAGAPVVAAVPPHRHAEPVLVAALAEAAARHTGLVAVHAHGREEAGHGASTDRDLLRTGLEASLAAARERAARAGVDVDAVRSDVEVVDGDPAEVLAERSTDARLLVLGSRGPGALAGLAVGSVSRAVLDRARCPVLVLPDRDPAPRPPSPSGHGRAARA